MQSVPALIAKLIKNSQVLALVEFGSNCCQSNFTEGDYDLLVILAELDYQAKTIHFYVGDTPVDLNLRTIDYFRQLTTLSGFEKAFVKGRVIYDPTGEITQIIHRLQQQYSQTQPEPLTENDIMRIRHWHKHMLDKVQGRLNSQSTFCHFLLSTNIFWLIENYFRIRKLPNEGLNRAFDYLVQNEPEIYSDIQDYYATSSLEGKIQIVQRLTELILQPIGGMWRNEEILAFGSGASQELQEQGQEIFKLLFGRKE